ncbi:MAG: hypothetical protein FGM24_10465 [Candidatus Kapabacteria bacterium]|nr:hypothetical protein [Candidatus Kapabacteria bacterium]
MYKLLLAAILGLAVLQSASAQAIMTQDLASRYGIPVHVSGINSDADDYGPRFDPVGGSIYLTSERSGTAAIYVVRTGNGQGTSLFDDASVTNVGGTLNETGKHRAFASFSASGDAVAAAYIMRSARPQVGIISVLRDGAQLNAGLPIEIMNGEFFCSHPTLSASGTRMIVARDQREDGNGLDLYISERMSGGEWSTPSPLSSVINSTGNEMTPVFIGNDSLLFASDGYGGRGGMDLFLTVYEDGTWQEPTPLDWLNTEFDETDACMLADGTLLFASNRPGGRGGLDIYVVRRKED